MYLKFYEIILLENELNNIIFKKILNYNPVIFIILSFQDFQSCKNIFLFFCFFLSLSLSLPPSLSLSLSLYNSVTCFQCFICFTSYNFKLLSHSQNHVFFNSTECLFLSLTYTLSLSHYSGVQYFCDTILVFSLLLSTLLF